jgi:hypothetical protein
MTSTWRTPGPVAPTEPPRTWISSATGPPDRSRELGRFVRQEAPARGSKRPIPGTVPGMNPGVAEPDRIARELRRAMGGWRMRRDPVALRLAIVRLLAMPEMAEARAPHVEDRSRCYTTTRLRSWPGLQRPARPGSRRW